MQTALLAGLLLVASPDPGKDVLAVFARKCVDCHGPDVAKPEGDPPFGYVLDLKRLAADGDKVQPGNPDDSNLMKLVAAGNMPPGDAKTGPLTADEKETVRVWIAAGAPEARPVVSPPPEESVADPAPATTRGVPKEERSALPGPTPAPASGWHRSVIWAGKWHLLLLHFPIAFIVAGAGRELWSMWKRSWEADDQARLSIALAALSSIPVALLGWLYAYNGAGAGSPNLDYHRWLGTVSAGFLVTLMASSEADARAGKRSLLVRVLIFTGAALVCLTAHYGARTLHGSTFLDW